MQQREFSKYSNDAVKYAPFWENSFRIFFFFLSYFVLIQQTILNSCIWKPCQRVSFLHWKISIRNNLQNAHRNNAEIDFLLQVREEGEFINIDEFETEKDKESEKMRENASSCYNLLMCLSFAILWLEAVLLKKK